jgi:hypothetical protein
MAEKPLSLWRHLKRKSTTRNLSNDSSLSGNGASQPLKEAFGLFPLIPETFEPQQPGTESQAFDDVDIVAVHGLGGDRYRTWTHPNGTLWLRDVAVNQLPGARIYTFGYDSGVAFSKGTSTIRDFARILLEELRLARIGIEVIYLS